jgi:hypothetical protein
MVVPLPGAPNHLRSLAEVKRPILPRQLPVALCAAKSASGDGRPLRWLVTRRSRAPWLLWICCGMGHAAPVLAGQGAWKHDGRTAGLFLSRCTWCSVSDRNAHHPVFCGRQTGGARIAAGNVDRRAIWRRTCSGLSGVACWGSAGAGVGDCMGRVSPGAGAIGPGPPLLVVAAILLPIDFYCLFWVASSRNGSPEGVIAMGTTVFET